LLGHVGNNSGDCTGNTWEYKTLTLGSFSVQTDIWARIRLIIGTDSGFEGRKNATLFLFHAGRFRRS